MGPSEPSWSEILARILEMADHIAAGDLTARLQVRPDGDLGDLCRAIDSIADALAQRQDKLEAVARQAGQAEKQASIGRLAAGVAHEINNPLTGVLTFAQLLRDSEGRSDDDRRSLDIIIRETTRVREIVRGLLNFARETPPTMRAIDVNEVVRASLDLVRRQSDFHKVTLVEDYHPDRLVVWADRNQLTQVFLNLVVNAAQSMPQGGTLTVATREREASKVAIAVSDQGCGITKDNLQHIFDPFFSTKPIGSGTGLGLSVSHGIVTKHRGRIEVESHVGLGSTFTVVLPLAEQDGPGRERSEPKSG
jgi:two-component system NtrC family sensor kinase